MAYMRVRGLPDWHALVVEHLQVTTPAALQKLTMGDLRNLATKAGFSPEVQVLQQVLDAIKIQPTQAASVQSSSTASAEPEPEPEPQR